MPSTGPASFDRLEVHTVPVSPKTTWLLLALHLADGTTGWGEITDFGNEAAIRDDVAVVARALTAARPSSLADVLGLITGRREAATRRLVRNGLEQAWLDAQAQAAGLPLATLLGGPYRRAVPVYANINRGIPATRTPQDFADRARLAVADGYRMIKIAPFDGVHWRRQDGFRSAFERGIARILALRDAIGTDIDIAIDCHSRLDPIAAARLLDAVAPAAPYWLEDVLDPTFGADDQRHLRQAAHRRSIRIAGGEEIADLPEFMRFLAAEGTDVVLPDLRLTGVRTGMTMCELAAAAGRLVSLHNPVGPVLDAVSQHAAAAMAEFLVLERPVRESPLWQQLRGTAPLVADGLSPLPEGPGLGLSLDGTALADAAAEAQPAGVASFRGMAGAGPDA